MLKRLVLTGAFVIGIIISSGFEADAGSISGWSYKCCSELTGDVLLKGAPNPITKPTALIATMTLQLESFCKNPAGGSFSTQVTNFTKSVQVGVPLAEGQVLDNGKILVDVDVSLDPLVVCTNGNGDWTVVPDSTGVTAATIYQTWYACTGSDSTPCFRDDGTLDVNLSKPIDSANIACTLDLLRNPDGTVVHGQELICAEF